MINLKISLRTFTPYLSFKVLLMEEIRRKPTWGVKNPVNNGIDHQPQLVQDFFHQPSHLDHVLCFTKMFTTRMKLNVCGKQPLQFKSRSIPKYH